MRKFWSDQNSANLPPIFLTELEAIYDASNTLQHFLSIDNAILKPPENIATYGNNFSGRYENSEVD